MFVRRATCFLQEFVCEICQSSIVRANDVKTCDWIVARAHHSQSQSRITPLSVQSIQRCFNANVSLSSQNNSRSQNRPKRAAFHYQPIAKIILTHKAKHTTHVLQMTARGSHKCAHVCSPSSIHHAHSDASFQPECVVCPKFHRPNSSVISGRNLNQKQFGVKL